MIDLIGAVECAVCGTTWHPDPQPGDGAATGAPGRVERAAVVARAGAGGWLLRVDGYWLCPHHAVRFGHGDLPEPISVMELVARVRARALR